MKYAVYRDKIISEQRTIMQKHEQYEVKLSKVIVCSRKTMLSMKNKVEYPMKNCTCTVHGMEVFKEEKKRRTDG